MRNITLFAAAAVVTYIGFAFLFGRDAEGPTELAEDELLGLKEHFKSLDALGGDNEL
jgi:hypothetical protein